MKKIVLVALMVLAIPVMASHIVGGEFEILHISGSTYRINLILYFDLKFGSPDAKDGSVTAHIYRKSDNRFMTAVFLPLTDEHEVAYTQPECSHGEIRTNKLIYTTTMAFPAETYNDPQGYYIVWERCCRNYNSSGLINILSEPPPQGVVYYPRSAGQTFYLEFPPVVKNGEPFINSTPRLFPPLNDYACPQKFYYADFAGRDDDGDSLVYSLVEPFNTHSALAFPEIQPAPFDPIQWIPPFGPNNIIGGNPDLKISTDGLLTVTPGPQGLFVFAVKVEEFRANEKIGEVRRDFQMLVVDACPQAEEPQILGKKLDESTFTNDEYMYVQFSNGIADETRCIEVQITDPDALKQVDNFSERVWIKAVPLGFKKNVKGILPADTTATLTPAHPSETFTICFDECPFVEGPFMVGIVVHDDACAQPLFDTLKVLVNITPPPNHNARWVTNDITQVVTEGSGVRKWMLKAVDEDGDIIELATIPGLGVVPALAGMTINNKGQVGDTLYVEFSWDPRCDVFDFTNRTQFDLRFKVEDQDDCLFKHPDALSINLGIILPGNNRPLIYSPQLTNSDPSIGTVNLTRKINESLNFEVVSVDLDNDKVKLYGKGMDFSLDTYNASFPPKEGIGFVSSQFDWALRCSNINLNNKSEFTFHFIAMDEENKCRFKYSDTLVVNVHVDPPDNLGPKIFLANLNSDLVLTPANTMEVILGQPIEFGLSGTDANTTPEPDLLRLELIEASGSVTPAGYIFAPAQGNGFVETTFTWNPACEIFQNSIYENTYTFAFRVIDDRCFNVKGDTVSVDVTIKDVDGSDDDFIPPNFISPNGDGDNDFFAMVKLDETTGQLVNILPLDNCAGHFERVSIFDRWGRPVFESLDREFRWYANNESTGEYFYLLKYSDKQYKGIISLTGTSEDKRQ